MVESYRRRRDLVIARLDQMEGVKTYKPDGAFYIFPDVSHYFGKSSGEYTINDSNDLSMYILNLVMLPKRK